MDFTFPFTLDVTYVILVVAITEVIFTSLAYFNKFYTAPVKVLITLGIGAILAGIDVAFAAKSQELTKDFVQNILLNFAVAQASYDLVLKNLKTFFNNYVSSKFNIKGQG